MDKEKIIALIMEDVDKTRRGKRRVNQVEVSKAFGIGGGPENFHIHQRYRRLIREGIAKTVLTNRMIAGGIYRYLTKKKSIQNDNV